MASPTCSARRASRSLAVFVFIAVCAFPPTAAAQDGTETEPPPTPEEVEEIAEQEREDEERANDEELREETELSEPKPPTESGTDIAAWDLYHQAFTRFVEGDTRGSLEALNELVEEYPDHPAARRARTVRKVVERATDVDLQEPAPDAPESTSSLARAEVVSFQTLHGIGVGIETCVLLECNDARATAAVLIASGGAGLGVSLFATRGGIKPGLTLALNSGTTWGFWNGMSVTHLADIQGTQGQAAALLAFQGLGMGTGALAHTLWDVNAGQVSLATSGSLWLNALAVWGFGIGDFTASIPAMWGTLLAATNVGAVAGGLLWEVEPMSRGRVLIIDSGGVLGALVGLGIPVLIEGDTVAAPRIFAGALAGNVVGLALATWFSRGWDAPATPEKKGTPARVTFGITPALDDSGATLTAGGRF